MAAKYGYGQTKVRNSPAPSEKWLREASFTKGLSTSARMDAAMKKHKKKKLKKKKREAVLVTGINTANRNK